MRSMKLNNLTAQITLELTLLVMGRGKRIGWLIRVLLASMAVLSLGLLSSLEFGDLKYIYLSLPGVWLLSSALMMDNTVEIKESGLVKILLQTYGPSYMGVRYLLYTVVTIPLSISFILLGGSIVSLMVGVGLSGLDVLPLLSLPVIGSTALMTVTVLLLVKIGGLRLLDTFSLASGGLTLLLIISMPSILEALKQEMLACMLLVGTFSIAALTTVYLTKHDFPALLTV